MRIDQFTTPYSDMLCEKLGIHFIAEHLTRARNKDDIVIDVPGYRQTKSYTCGFVSGLMVVRTFFPNASHKKFHDICEMHPEWGMSTRKVANALRKSGIGVRVRPGLTFHEIAEFIERGEPMMTAVKRHKDIQHWVVIYGVNRKRKELFIAGEKFWFSPAETVYKWNEIKKQIPKGTDFLVCWKKT
jgi:hypothetical protein